MSNYSIIKKPSKAFNQISKQQGRLEIDDEKLTVPLYSYIIDDSAIGVPLTLEYPKTDEQDFDLGEPLEFVGIDGFTEGRIPITEDLNGTTILNTRYTFQIKDFEVGVSSQTWNLQLYVERDSNLIPLEDEVEKTVQTSDINKFIELIVETDYKIGEFDIIRPGDSLVIYGRMSSQELAQAKVIYETIGHDFKDVLNSDFLSEGHATVFAPYNTITDTYSGETQFKEYFPNIWTTYYAITPALENEMISSNQDLYIDTYYGFSWRGTFLGTAGFKHSLRVRRISPFDHIELENILWRKSGTGGNQTKESYNLSGIVTLQDVQNGYNQVFTSGLVTDGGATAATGMFNNIDEDFYIKISLLAGTETNGSITGGDVELNTSKLIAPFGNSIDGLLETIKKVETGGTLVVPLKPDDTIQDGLFLLKPNGGGLSPQENLENFDLWFVNDESGNFLANKQVPIDKVQRFFSFTDLELSNENPTVEGETLTGQYIINDTQFYSIQNNKKNYNDDGSISNYEWDIRKINAYSAKNENEEAIKIIFIIGSRQPEPYRYLQMTFKDFLFLKEFTFFDGINNVEWERLVLDKKIVDGQWVDNPTEWNYIFANPILRGNVYDWQSPWLGEQRFITRTFNETSQTGKTDVITSQRYATIPGEYNYLQKTTAAVAIQGSSVNDIFKAITGRPDYDSSQSPDPYININGLGLNQTQAREETFPVNQNPAWKTSASLYSNELMLYEIPAAGWFWYYSKSNPNTVLTQEQIDANKTFLLKGSLVFNSIDYSNSSWIGEDGNVEIVPVEKNSADYFNYTNNPDDASFMMLMPTTIEKLLAEIESNPQLGNLSPIEVVPYSIRNLLGFTVGEIRVANPATCGTNIIKNELFFRNSNLSGEHVVVLDFGSNKKKVVEEYQYYGGSERLVERYVDNQDGTLTRAKDVEGRELPTQYLPVIQKRFNGRVGMERLIIL